MTSVFNTDASLLYNHDLFESIIHSEVPIPPDTHSGDLDRNRQQERHSLLLEKVRHSCLDRCCHQKSSEGPGGYCSTPYNRDLFGSLIVKKRVKVEGEGDIVLTYHNHSEVPTPPNIHSGNLDRN
ncbi:hypothetical protein T265_04466 [Opisthorchis viverrini]|uniref:Uncharacterized protein n=1 Tax=Opisthorchis viverrini TaxID=6198 RepID=A0A074ZZQ8_OPIVI|nr:hypothetical protein T265_04466 [Opisthorchis viverrini]KER28775.1 hypothetical protein T265_04466 [Opisthorchis viverrini]